MSWLVVSPGEARPAVKYAPLGPLTVFQRRRRSEPGTRFLDLDGMEEISVDDLALSRVRGVAIVCLGVISSGAGRVQKLVCSAFASPNRLWSASTKS